MEALASSPASDSFLESLRNLTLKQLIESESFKNKIQKNFIQFFKEDFYGNWLVLCL